MWEYVLTDELRVLIWKSNEINVKKLEITYQRTNFFKKFNRCIVDKNVFETSVLNCELSNFIKVLDKGKSKILDFFWLHTFFVQTKCRHILKSDKQKGFILIFLIGKISQQINDLLHIIGFASFVPSMMNNICHLSNYLMFKMEPPSICRHHVHT